MILNQAVFIKNKMYTRGKIISAEKASDRRSAKDWKYVEIQRKILFRIYNVLWKRLVQRNLCLRRNNFSKSWRARTEKDLKRHYISHDTDELIFVGAVVLKNFLMFNTFLVYEIVEVEETEKATA